MNLDVLSQYGILGLIAGALWLFAQGAIKRERERLDKSESINDVLTKQLFDQKLNEDIIKREQERANKAEAQRDASYAQMDKFVIPALTALSEAMSKTYEQVSLLIKAQEKADIIRQWQEGQQDGKKP